MPSIEILAPAGNMDSLKAALSAGADAIYCAGKSFGARAYAANFDHDQLKQAVDLVHLYGAKLYVTMNTLVYEAEIDAAFEEACFLYQIGVDALLIQDIGLFDLLHHRLPDLPLHCSTQMNIHDVNGVRFAKKIGASRVVLAREASRKTVQACCNEGIEIEVFGYGALCSAYSGECLISAYSSQRSGNRGQCAQNCRLDYTLWQDGKKVPQANGNYLMSLQDLNLIDHLPDLINDGVSSVKIEGRMKSPAYVYMVTSLFKKARDAYDAKQPFHVSDDESMILKVLFNRGFTIGYYYGQHDRLLRSSKRPNHQGIPVATVIGVNEQKITLKLDAPIKLHDGLRVLNRKEDVGIFVSALLLKGQHIKQASSGMNIDIPGHFDVKVNDVVVKTSDQALADHIDTLVETNHQRVGVDITMSIHGQHIDLMIQDPLGRGYTRTIDDIFIQPAKNQPMNETLLSKSFSKLKDTPFYLNSVHYSGDDVFMSMANLNRCRRELIDGFMEMIQSSYKRVLKPLDYPKESFDLPSIEPLAVNLTYGSTNTYPHIHTIAEAMNGQDHLAPLIYSDISHKNDATYIQYIGDIDETKWQIGLHGILCANSYALQAYYRLRLIPMAAFELDDQKINALIEAYQSRNGSTIALYQQIQGNWRLMSMRDCLIKANFNEPLHCNRCHTHTMTLTDRNQHRYHLEGDIHCVLHLYTTDMSKRELVEGCTPLLTFEG